MAPALRVQTADQITGIIRKLGNKASFRNILLEANTTGLITDHRTLRRYLDLLLHAEVLTVRERDVGSVNPQQLYRIATPQPHLWVGTAAMRLHGLNWDVPDAQLVKITTDLEAMVRAGTMMIQGKTLLIGGLEDTLVHELIRDAYEHTGMTELVAAMLATRSLDLSYLLRRADSLGVGQALRLLLGKITNTFTSLPGDVDGRAFLAARTQFLRILRSYNSRRVLRLVETPGKGRIGLGPVSTLKPEQIVSTTGKQLGVTG